ncbi:MAG TPA: GntR family transcriptional regulator [Porticoccus sp.]|nr:GntR family transcriptional regulator [Porticoccus sp.]
MQLIMLFYQDLARDLSEQIRSGNYRVGDRLPSLRIIGAGEGGNEISDNYYLMFAIEEEA